jgi:hypothetical protein
MLVSLVPVSTAVSAALMSRRIWSAVFADQRREEPVPSAATWAEGAEALLTKPVPPFSASPRGVLPLIAMP